MIEGVSRNVWRKNDFKYCGFGHEIKLLSLIEQFFLCIKWSHQRVCRGYCDRDIWDMFSYLQSLLPAMLQQLKDTRNGSPGFLGENYVNDEGILVNDTCHEVWDMILEQMIFLWHESDELACSVKNEFEDEYMNSKEINNQEIKEKYYSREKEIEKYREECKDRAFDMLKEYFFCLWD